MILHIPHSSTRLGDVVFEKDVEHELNIMTDWFTNELFYHKSAASLVFPFSRLICDVERFEKIADEPMERYGMGICYTKRSDGSFLKTVTDKDRLDIIHDLYLPHHKRLVDLIYGQMSYYKNTYLVDCHSFSGTRLPHEEGVERPDICLGTDVFHTPRSVVVELLNYFVDKGYSVYRNKPFTGTMVPHFFRANLNFKSIMIEVNRDLYLNEHFQANENYEKVQKDITGALNIISAQENL